MKTTVFYLKYAKRLPEPTSSTQSAEYCVPTLPAYAVEYSILKTPTGFSGMDLDYDMSSEEYEGDGFELQDDTVIWKNFRSGLIQDITPILYVYYHGIRDYALLFPSVQSEELQTRLGEFYQEAEKTFESGAWLSFSLMCAAIFEGLLVSQVRDRGFAKLIDAAHGKGLLSRKEADMMNLVREQRNLVHASRYNQDYVSRKVAMDIRKTLDDVVKKFSCLGAGQ